MAYHPAQLGAHKRVSKFYVDMAWHIIKQLGHMFCATHYVTRPSYELI